MGARSFCSQFIRESAILFPNGRVASVATSAAGRMLRIGEPKGCGRCGRVGAVFFGPRSGRFSDRRWGQMHCKVRESASVVPGGSRMGALDCFRRHLEIGRFRNIAQGFRSCSRREAAFVLSISQRDGRDFRREAAVAIRRAERRLAFGAQCSGISSGRDAGDFSAARRRHL